MKTWHTSILSLQLSILLCFILGSGYAQNSLVLHPVLGKRIEYRERRINDFDRILKLKIPSWHGLYYSKSEDGSHLFYSLEDSSLAPKPFSEEEYQALLARIEKENALLLSQVALLKEELQNRERVGVTFKVFGGKIRSSVAVEVGEGYIAISEPPLQRLELPLQDIQHLWVSGLDYSPEKGLSSYPFVRDRLFVTHTALPLNKGEINYQNILLAGQKFRIGLNEHFAIGFGFETLISLLSSLQGDFVGPIYFSASAGTQVNNSDWHLAAEAQFLHILDVDFMGALSLVATKGDAEENLTLRTFALFADNYGLGSLFGIGMGYNKRISRRWFLTSENLAVVEHRRQMGTSPDFWRINSGFGMINSLGFKYLNKRYSIEFGLSATTIFSWREHHSPLPNEPSIRSFRWQGITPVPFITYAYWLKPYSFK